MESSRLKQKSNKPQIPPTNLKKSSRISQIRQTSHNSQVNKPVTDLTNSQTSQIPPTNLTKSSRISQIPQTSQIPPTNLTKSSRISQIPQTRSKSLTSSQVDKSVTNQPNRQTSQNAFTILANMSQQQGILRNCPPYYLSEAAWNGLVDYWESEGFAKLSEAGRENVMKSEIKHCSGAKPFDHRYEELEEKASKPLTILEKFDASYKKKGQVEEIGRKLKDVVERTVQEELSQDAPPSLVSQRKRELELWMEVCPPKKGKVLMFPRHTLLELIGRDEAAKWTTSQSTSACIPERVPKSAYSIIGKVMTEVTNMVEALDEIEVTRARLEEEVQKLANRAYPNKDDPASKILWEEYIRIAAQMTSPLFERYKKVIIEDTRSDQMVLHENVSGVDLEDLQTRYPL